MVPNDAPGIWTISVQGDKPLKLSERGTWPTFSPDGSLIAFGDVVEYITGYGGCREIWVMGSNGDQPRKLVEAKPGELFDLPAWAPNGRRVAYRKLHAAASEIIIESRDLKGEQPATVVSDSQLTGALCWLPDGRIIYSRAESFPTQESNLWEIRTNLETGRPTGTPRRITAWAGAGTGLISASADGKRLMVIKGTEQSHVYVAELQAHGTRLSALRRLTLDESNDQPRAWTPDSKAVIFTSDRNGHGDIYKQGIDQTTAETIVASPENKFINSLSPDGAWVYYRPLTRPSAPGKLMRVPMSGGPAQFISNTEPGFFFLACARLPSTFCVYTVNEQGQYILSSFDLANGKKHELARVKGATNADIFPDGSGMAVIIGDPSANRIRIIGSAGETKTEFAVKGWSEIIHIFPSADSKGLYLTGSVATSRRRATLCRSSGECARPLATEGQYRLPRSTFPGRPLSGDHGQDANQRCLAAGKLLISDYAVGAAGAAGGAASAGTTRTLAAAILPVRSMPSS